MIHLANADYPFPDEGGPGVDRDCVGNAGQTCPQDGAELGCVNDYSGGGSHYWVLVCPGCTQRFTYDNHASTLRSWPR